MAGQVPRVLESQKLLEKLRQNKLGGLILLVHWAECRYTVVGP